MRILITGSSGFIGSHLCNQLYADGHEIVALGSEGENKPLCKFFIKEQLHKINWGEKIFDDIDVVFHQSANNNTLDNDEANMMSANYYEPIRMFNELKLKNCKRFVYASSTAVYGNERAPYVENITPIQPLNVYGRSKAKFDEFAMQFALDTGSNVVGLRYCNVYGSGENIKGKRASMVSQIIKKMKNFESISLFKDGTQLREWIYVKDVVRANILAMQFEGREIFNCGTGKPCTFNKLVEILSEFLSLKSCEIKYVDNPYYKTYQNHVETDMNKSEKELGFIPSLPLLAENLSSV